MNLWYPCRGDALAEVTSGKKLFSNLNIQSSVQNLQHSYRIVMPSYKLCKLMIRYDYLHVHECDVTVMFFFTHIIYETK